MKTKKIRKIAVLSAALWCFSSAEPTLAYQSHEAQEFMAGFTAYKKGDYSLAIGKLSPLLSQPDSQLRELTLLFLARSYFRDGKGDESAFLIRTWEEEFPHSTLKASIEQDVAKNAQKLDVAAYRSIKLKREQERIAREQAEAARLAAIKAEEERKAREKAEAERIAREKAEAERIAKLKAEEERRAREKAEAERIAREKAEAERIAKLKAEEERRAREKAEAERIAREKAEAERIAQEKAAAERIASHKAYIYTAVSTPASMLAIPSEEQVVEVAKEATFPVVVTNPGVVPDRFALSLVAPSSWNGAFVQGGKHITETPEIPPGGSVKLSVALTLPANLVDGQNTVVPLRMVSKIADERPVIQELRLTASAPLVRAIVKSIDRDEKDPSRGHCLVSVLNVGSAAAERLVVSLNHSKAYTAVQDTDAPLSKVSRTTLKSRPLKLQSGEMQEFLLDFQLKDEGRAKEGIACQTAVTFE